MELTTVLVRKARKVDVYQIAGFHQGPVTCPRCPCRLQYRPATGRAYCVGCQRTWHALDILLSRDVLFKEAVITLTTTGGEEP